MRKLIWWLLGLVAVILIAAAVSVAYVRTSLPDRNDTVAVAGLHAPVDVTWDEYAIPRIQAASIEDAAFAQGYVHAQDRLWQMELVRRAVQGRLAEVLGQPGLETDRFMRRLGLWNAAVAGEKLLNDRERRLLQAYADGVNAALDSWKGALPPEFLLLGYKPEPWRPAHTLAVAKMMSFTLASYGEAVGVARAVRRLGPDRARFLFPAFPDWGATILEPPAPPDTPPLAAALVDAFSVAAASNSWAVSW